MNNLPDFGALGAVKMGPGVVGRGSIVLVAVVVFCIFIAWFVRDYLWAVLFVFIVALPAILFGLFLLVRFAEKYPNHAIMEGGQFVRYTKLNQSAKDPNIIDVRPELTDNSPPSALEAPGGEDA